MKIVGAVLLLCAPVALRSQPIPPPIPGRGSGIIEGTVTDSAGRSGVSTKVRAVRLRPTGWTSRPVQASRYGTFRITGLADGEYVLCAAPPPRTLWVDPCFWLNPTTAGPTLRISAGQRLTEQAVRLQQGRRVRVRVVDPQRAIGAKQSSGATRNLWFRLSGPPGALLVHLQATRPEKDGQSYEVFVPANYAPTLSAYSTGLRLADEFGRELPATTFSQTIQLPAAATGITDVVFNVSAR